MSMTITMLAGGKMFLHNPSCREQFFVGDDVTLVSAIDDGGHGTKIEVVAGGLLFTYNCAENPALVAYLHDMDLDKESAWLVEMADPMEPDMHLIPTDRHFAERQVDGKTYISFLNVVPVDREDDPDCYLEEEIVEVALEEILFPCPAIEAARCYFEIQEILKARRT